MRIKQLYELIQEEESFDLLDLLVDRLDQVQTIENFFDFAFLIKVIFTVTHLHIFSIPYDMHYIIYFLNCISP